MSIQVKYINNRSNITIIMFNLLYSRHGMKKKDVKKQKKKENYKKRKIKFVKNLFAFV